MLEIEPSVIFFFSRFAVILKHITSANTIFKKSVAHLHLVDWVQFRSEKEYLVIGDGILRDCFSNGIEECPSILVLVTCHQDLERLHSINEQA